MYKLLILDLLQPFIAMLAAITGHSIFRYDFFLKILATLYAYSADWITASLLGRPQYINYNIVNVLYWCPSATFGLKSYVRLG